MPRVTKVDKCRKSPGKCSKCGAEIKVGSPYVWWQFAYSEKTIRCASPACAPKPQDLTRSEFWSAIYRIQETQFEGDCPSDLESAVEDIKSDLDNLKSETEDKLSNMPDGLQQGSTGEMLQERIDALDSAVSDIESVDLTVEEEEPEQKEGESDADFEARQKEWRDKIHEELEQKWSEVMDAVNNISCS